MPRILRIFREPDERTRLSARSIGIGWRGRLPALRLLWIAPPVILGTVSPGRLGLCSCCIYFRPAKIVKFVGLFVAGTCEVPTAVISILMGVPSIVLPVPRLPATSTLTISSMHVSPLLFDSVMSGAKESLYIRRIPLQSVD